MRAVCGIDGNVTEDSLHSPPPTTTTSTPSTIKDFVESFDTTCFILEQVLGRGKMYIVCILRTHPTHARYQHTLACSLPTEVNALVWMDRWYGLATKQCMHVFVLVRS
jgi:hypothetical protein